MTSCSIIIPAHNEEGYILDCLESIFASWSPDVTEVIVVDNASSDRTGEIARSLGSVTVVREDRKGTSYARERGFHESSGELLVFIDADSRLSSSWVERAKRWFTEHPNIVCVSGPYLCYDQPKFWNIVSLAYWWLCVLPAALFTRSVAIGGGMMIRRSALEKAGGFDTSVTFYGDDTSIAKRLRKVGVVRFDPRLLIWSSGRRFKDQGIARVGWTYACNFVTQICSGKSVTKTNEDIR